MDVFHCDRTVSNTCTMAGWGRKTLPRFIWCLPAVTVRGVSILWVPGFTWQQPPCLPVNNSTPGDTPGLELSCLKLLVPCARLGFVPVFCSCTFHVFVNINGFFLVKKYVFASWHIVALLSNIDTLVCILILNKCLIRFFPPAQIQ